MAPFSFVSVDGFAPLQEAVNKIVGDKLNYAFRGYCAPDPNDDPGTPRALVTGLEHVCRDIDQGLGQAPVRETALLREFLRRAHHYIADLPALRDMIEWLALMQHHGAPTRLLDWTYSLHVAAHFALFKASRQANAGLAIWVINTEWCYEAAKGVCLAEGRRPLGLLARPIHRGESTASGDLLGKPPLPLSVWPLSPFRLNERLTLQKGLFLAPANIQHSFSDNLRALPGHGDQSNLVCFLLPRAAMTSLGKTLHDTNVTEATLFPGIDGFARSLSISARYLDLRFLDRGFSDL